MRTFGKYNGQKTERGNAAMAFKKGWSVVKKANEEKAPKKDITAFNSGDTLTVKFKSLDDVVQYHAYGIYEVVKTFVPTNPATFNEDGFPEENLTSWDKAAKYFYDKAREADSEKEAKALREKGSKLSAKARFLLGLYDVTSGEDIVIDLTKNQAGVVMESLFEYVDTDADGNPIPDGEHDFVDMVFKLSKKGTGRGTVVSLSPIVNLKKGLTAEEQANLEAEAATTPIPDSAYEDLLYERDHDDMLRGLVDAGFNLALIGETAPAPKEDDTDTEDDDTVEENPENKF